MIRVKYGTCHFPSHAAAMNYYRDYLPYHDREWFTLLKLIQQKIDDGEIVIGKPVVPAGCELCLIDDGTRYAIAEPAI